MPPLTRRDFLYWLGLAAATSRLSAANADSSPVIRTVLGDLPPAALGLTLVHEHVLVDFIGADRVSASRYDADEVFRTVLPHFEQAAALGVRTVFECTPAFIGRDVNLLVRLSRASGVNLVTNTGLYGAAGDKFLPPWAFTETAEQLAARWIAEARDGIDGTGVRPGFIKSGVDPAPELSPVDRKLVAAAALAHRSTGLTIAVHTGSGPGNAQLEELRRHGVAPAAFVWVHAQGAPDDALIAAAEAGAWLSFDGLAEASLSRHLELCRLFRRRGQLDRVLLSHDAGWFDPAKPQGGTFRPYDLLFTGFLPQLRATGFSEDEIHQMLALNPAKAYAVTPRLL
jgi:phosphotriesterase-related protein